LHISGLDQATVAPGVLVLDLAVENVGNGFESAVRVVGRSFGLARSILRRPHLVEQQEGPDIVETSRWKRPTHQETGALVSGDGVDGAKWGSFFMKWEAHSSMPTITI
jgi:hypothetical protein